MVKPSPGRATRVQPGPGIVKAMPAARSVTAPSRAGRGGAADPVPPASTSASSHAATPATTIAAAPTISHLLREDMPRPAAGPAARYAAAQDSSAGSRHEACRLSPPPSSPGKTVPG
jgi:hypothetical protein